MCGDRLQQLRRDAIRITVKETNPVEFFDLRETLEQSRQAVAQSEILAVEGRVLADQGNFAHARGSQILRFADHRFESPAAEFAAKLRDDAEATGMIAALVNLDVGSVARRRQHARREIVI